MSNRQRYKKKADQSIIAVQINLETEGFTYRKWGAEQWCKRGDWLVDNGGECYTIDAEAFAQTYRQVSAGNYVKTTPVWAAVATETGSVVTKEGESHYRVGDYLVSNNEDGSDAYCVSAAKFESMYEMDK